VAVGIEHEVAQKGRARALSDIGLCCIRSRTVLTECSTPWKDYRALFTKLGSFHEVAQNARGRALLHQM